MHAPNSGGTLIYDGECSLCRKAVDWIDARSTDPNLRAITCQSTECRRAFPELDEAECMRAMQYIDPEGAVFAGAEALPPILLKLKGWRWMARVLKLPVVSWIAPRAYGFVAKRRYVFSILVAEKSSKDDACLDDACDPTETNS